jgi:CubicO group peptidase (beta-lactamase class C family)
MNREALIEIGNYLDDLTKAKDFSGAVLISNGDDVLFKNCYGLANYEYNIPVTMDTRYCIASITKSITAMAVLILEDEGKLSVLDTLDKYIPDYPKGSSVTIHNLLTHTSGITEIFRLPDIDSFSNKRLTIEEAVAKFKDKPLDFCPGEKFNYSNSGYILLAHIIEQLSGMSYEEFIKDRIFDKLSMKDTGCYYNENVLKNKAYGYNKVEGEIKTTLLPNMSIFYGAGNLYSTLDDLFVWTRALLKGELLSRESSQVMLKELGQIEGDFYYGYGKIVGMKDGKIDYFYQDGGLSGYRSIYLVYPSKDITVIVLTNLFSTKLIEICNKIESLI